jgi:hypothetical protein
MNSVDATKTDKEFINWHAKSKFFGKKFLIALQPAKGGDML